MAKGFGRGPVQPDPRKFRYDVTLARTKESVAFSASKADRMSAEDAGRTLHAIHVMFGIDREAEEMLLAFDRALWFEHTINGASMLQSGSGVITVGDTEFDISEVRTLLGEKARRFYRAYADEIAACNREVLASYSAYDPVSVEMVGQLRQVAVERGLQKFPWLAHDSSDACVAISMEERVALIASKRLVIGASVNKVDQLPERVSEGRSGPSSS